MEKIWQVLPKITEDFKNKYPEYSRLVLQLLFNRGIIEKEAMEEYLSFDYEKYSHDPFLFNDMEAAVNLIIKHIKEGNNIVVYGDYDADGVTACAVMVETLETLKAKVDIYIPDRVAEGNGFNLKALEVIVYSGAKLIITVDTGIRSAKEAAEARKNNIDIIITDHHQPPKKKEEYPDCIIVNPAIPEEKYPYKKLAGVGVAFKLAKALVDKSRLSLEDKKNIENKILDLVAIGTVADCVSLLGENRILVKKGLDILNKTKRAGLKELIKIACIENKRLKSWNIGFQIAPRLNAAGRMGHANTAYELLVTRREKEAKVLAGKLNEKNIERQKLTEEIIIEVEKQINKEQIPKIIISTCQASFDEDAEEWNEGIIGLVAGRISSKYYRPVLVITNSGDEYKGSGRSIKEFNLIKAVEASAEYLLKYGGHPGACGFSLKKENLNKFIKKISEITEKELKDLDLRPKIDIEAVFDLSKINEELINEIENFSPFGEGNERPVFASHNITVMDIYWMGMEKQHVKFRVKSDNSTVLSAIGFSQAEKWKDIIIGDKIDMLYYLELNNYNGKTEAQLKIIDIKIKVDMK
ncbi:single-stranded-DNA-specific exonuclease RecJ [Candidatus Falkowbacteria bacterium]|nr:MAG: single-stranded-DNA-specific exonuclease RecJ [Candidatus Falkowbacteria bacterium]